MADVQITCIRKPHPLGRHEHITHVGSGGQIWTREQVIAWIDRKEHSFYTSVGGKRANIGVRREQGKASYLQTHADGYWNDNLLALAQCP